MQNKHVEMLVDKRLSELVYERVPLLRQIREVKPDWHRRYNIGTGGLHHGGHDVQVIVPARYDAHCICMVCDMVSICALGLSKARVIVSQTGAI